MTQFHFPIQSTYQKKVYLQAREEKIKNENEEEDYEKENVRLVEMNSRKQV